MSKYDVTIAIPVFNAKIYLHETMMAALEQDYSSIEFLIVDDCSSDGSIDIIHQLQQNHPRGKDIRIVSLESNIGIGAVRNRILEEAQGQYLYFLDADDLIVPTTISLMMSAAREHDAELVMASYERVEKYNHTSPTVLYQFPNKVFTKPNEFAAYAFSSYAPLQANIWNVLMDLRVIREYHLQFVDTNFWEDMVFKYNLVTYVTRAALLSDVTYSYICRENSLSNFQKREIISKDEIYRNVATIETLKSRCQELLCRPFFANWLQFVLDTDFYIICNVLRKRNIITPRISNRELRDILHSPLSVMTTLRYGNIRCRLYKVLSILPPCLSVRFLNVIAKKR